MHRREEIIDAVQEELGVYFNSTRTRWFIGGSRRFGYSNSMSDLDLFANISISIDQFEDDMLKMGFRIKATSSPYPDDTWELGNIIHVVNMRIDGEFCLLRELHNKMENLFEKNKAFAMIAKSLKEHGLSGKDIFNVFRHLV